LPGTAVTPVGACGGPAAMVAVAADVALALPAVLVAVTLHLTVVPRSVSVNWYDDEVAPLMSVEAPRTHWY